MFSFDPALYALVNANAQTPLLSIEAARFISGWVPNLSLIVVALGFVRGSPALRRSLVLLLMSMAIAWCIARLIRWGFPTPRPAQLNMGTQWLQHGGRASFPSMHASGAFALAMAVSLGSMRHRTTLVAFAWMAALAMAWSRVHLGVHFPSDVMGGALVGICGAYLAWRLLLGIRRQRGLRWSRLRLQFGLQPR
ncbi:phosphatase PAP2 family protein [Comamonas aquatilis]|uniref:phosphatase PAP2 family protein n=1 Tax=Comamonas aquatilis TaxID=1778406 RepID=UPI0039F06F89